MPSDELFQWWSDRVGATGLALHGRRLREAMSDGYVLVTHPVVVGGGIPFSTALDAWVDLTLVETRAFPAGVLLTRYETRR